MGVKIDDKWCGALLCVDDFVLLPDNGVELQDMLDMVQDYVVRCKMKFNGKKSKLMVVGNGKGLKRNIDGEELEVLEAFRYLGVRVDGKLRGNVH